MGWWLPTLALCLAAWGCSGHDGATATTAGDADAEENHPTMIITDFRTQVQRDGVPQREIQAKWGRMDEASQTIDLRTMQVKFFDQKTTSGQPKVAGQARCGTGRMWLADHPEEAAHKNDALLKQDVIYTTPDGWMLKTPELHYDATSATLHSDKGYVEQLPITGGYYVGQGDRFELKLSLEKNTFETWKKYGKPTMLTKSTKPVIEQ